MLQLMKKGLIMFKKIQKGKNVLLNGNNIINVISIIFLIYIFC